MTPVCNVWCCYVLRSITAQPFHGFVLSLQQQSCPYKAAHYPKLFDGVRMGFSASQSCRDFSCLVYPPSFCVFLAGLCRWKGGVYIFLSVLWMVSVTPWDGSGWHGNATSPSHRRKQGGNSGSNSWSVNKAALRTCQTISKYFFRALCLQPFVVQMLCSLNVHGFTSNFFLAHVFF